MIWLAAVLALAALLVQRRNVSRTSDKPPDVPPDEKPDVPPVGSFTQVKTFVVEFGGAYAIFPIPVAYVLSFGNMMPAGLVQALQDAANPKKQYSETLPGGIVTQIGELTPKLWTFYGGVSSALSRAQLRVRYPLDGDPIEVISKSRFYLALKAGETKGISLESWGIPLSGKATRAGAIMPL
jgi:hypothetical protein